MRRRGLALDTSRDWQRAMSAAFVSFSCKSNRFDHTRGVAFSGGNAPRGRPHSRSDGPSSGTVKSMRDEWLKGIVSPDNASGAATFCI